MKQSLQLKLGQQLTMTPQLQQAIKLLQLSTLDLQQEIQAAIDSNPMLEVNEDEINEPIANQSESDSALTDSITASNQIDNSTQEQEAGIDEKWTDSIPEELSTDTSWDDVYQSNASSNSAAIEGGEDHNYSQQPSDFESLQQHLLWQLNLTPMTDRDRVIALSIVDAITPSGILSVSADELHQGLAHELDDLDLDEVFSVLHRVQQFDPPGIAGQDLGECLHIQLNQLPEKTPFREAAKLIVKDYLTLLGSRDYKQLMRRTRLKEGALKETIELIQTLNPHPGDQINSVDTEYVVPDVYVSKQNNTWCVSLNPDIAPKIRINSDYAALIKRSDNSQDNTFLKDNLQEAKWFLKSLMSRNETLLKVTNCIVDKQRGFFDYGPEAMKPLVLNEVAEIVGMHESTISRVTTAKYMHTPQGIFELKYFFSSHVSTDSGGECSSTAIRALIKKIVAAEPAKKPLSDNKIATLLADEGIKVARRTIAKYRESMNIPPSNERKRLI